jgi:hypothetical protein
MALGTNQKDEGGRGDLRELIQGPRGILGCVTMTFITDGGDIVPSTEAHIGYIATVISDVSLLCGTLTESETKLNVIMDRS